MRTLDQIYGPEAKSCDCDFCKEYTSNQDLMERTKDFRKLKKSDLELLRTLVMKNWERAMEAEGDNEYYQAIHAGTWPSAREQGLAIAQRAEAYQNEIESVRRANSVRRNLAVQEGSCRISLPGGSGSVVASVEAPSSDGAKSDEQH